MQSGMEVWDQSTNPNGKVVELHGNAGHLLCPHCHAVTEAKPSDLLHLKKCRPRVCSSCHQGELRFKIMLYDDEEASLITPEDVWNQFEADLKLADMLVWVGISFEQVCFDFLAMICEAASACPRLHLLPGLNSACYWCYCFKSSNHVPSRFVKGMPSSSLRSTAMSTANDGCAGMCLRSCMCSCQDS